MKVKAKLCGPLACFTHPLMKVNRVSYPVITPSAARNILQCVFWHPEMTLRILRVGVQNPIETISAPVIESKQRHHGGDNFTAIRKHQVVLWMPSYLVEADIEVKPGMDPARCNTPKYVDQFNRRLEGGQLFRSPFFGIRDFKVEIRPYVAAEEKVINRDADLGTMFYDYTYRGMSVVGRRWFQAVMKNGWVNMDEKEVEIL